MLEKREIEKSNFEKELKTVVDSKIKQGYKREQLIINLMVDKETRRGDIADLEVVMRRLNVRKIIYSTQ
jgi:adenosylcobinamide amidohydrolase